MKNLFETKADLRLNVTRLKNQIKALKISGKADPVIKSTLAPIVLEKSEVLEYISSNKTWNFNFQVSGWNSIVAKTREEAIKLAKKKYAKSKNLQVMESSFRVATESDTRALLSLFY